LQRTVQVVGTLYGDEDAVVSAKVAGRVRAISKDVGDAVAPGELLAQIDPVDFELTVANRQAMLQAALAEIGLTALPTAALDVDAVPAVQKAKIEAANAEARARRGAAMFAETPPLITEQEHADLVAVQQATAAAYQLAATEARAKAATAQVRAAELAQGQQMLRDAAVTAPTVTRYRVARRLVAAGEYVKEATAMFRLVAGDPIKFRADVPERHSAELRAGQQVSVEVPSQSRPVSGEIVRIAPLVDAQKRTFMVEIRIANPDGKLLPGGFARGAIATHVDAAVVFVPQDAIVVALGLSKVFTVVDGKAVEHKVTIGVHDGAFLEVQQSDLAAGDAVVVAGAARLAQGVTVTVTAAGAGK
jgi:RND family efflux transporter MFP subunit